MTRPIATHAMHVADDRGRPGGGFIDRIGMQVTNPVLFSPHTTGRREKITC